MELLYIGSVCSQKIFEQTVACSNVKPSASAQSFEMALVQGFSQVTNVNLSCISAESIATYPRGNRLVLRKRSDELCDGVSSTIVSAINLPGIKNAMHGFNVRVEIRKWLKKTNGKDRAVFLYGIYPAVAESALNVCKAAGCKCFCMITDIAQMMFTNTKSEGVLKNLFSKYYRKKAVELQRQFDGYVFLTEAMRDAVTSEKPYHIMETIVDPNLFDGISNCEKGNPPILMYAGALYKKYGTDRIVEAFEKITTPCQLWMFGSGDYEEELKEKASVNSRIHYGGRVSRLQVLENEKKATILLNLRNSEDEYTKYSFPSKMVEYMLSGTPVFTTVLSGMPTEYYNYCFATQTMDTNAIASQLEQLLNQPEKLREVGALARQFVVEEKNAKKQAEGIINFLI